MSKEADPWGSAPLFSISANLLMLLAQTYFTIMDLCPPLLLSGRLLHLLLLA